MITDFDGLCMCDSEGMTCARWENFALRASRRDLSTELCRALRSARDSGTWSSSSEEGVALANADAE